MSRDDYWKPPDFGWDLPPGVTHAMIDEAMGDSTNCDCECCGQPPPYFECPRCHSAHSPATLYGCERCDEDMKEENE